MAWAGGTGCVKTIGMTEKEYCPTHPVTSSVRGGQATVPTQPPSTLCAQGQADVDSSMDVVLIDRQGFTTHRGILAPQQVSRWQGLRQKANGALKGAGETNLLWKNLSRERLLRGI